VSARSNRRFADKLANAFIDLRSNSADIAGPLFSFRPLCLRNIANFRKWLSIPFGL